MNATRLGTETGLMGYWPIVGNKLNDVTVNTNNVTPCLILGCHGFNFSMHGNHEHGGLPFRPFSESPCSPGMVFMPHNKYFSL